MASDESKNRINATKFQIKFKLKKEIKNGLKQRGCHWNDYERAYVCENRHQELVAAYLETEGIKFNSESIYDGYFLLSKEEQAVDRISQAKKIIVLDGIEQLMYFQSLLKDYNTKWKMDLKRKDFENVTLDNLTTTATTNEVRQHEHLNALFTEYCKFKEKRNLEAELGKKRSWLPTEAKKSR